METKEICSDLAGSQSGELFYRCMAEFKDHTHWAGPFFSALFLGIIAGALIATIAESR